MPRQIPTLVIGNKTWSSWSMRPWLVLEHFGIAYEEEMVRLRAADTRTAILAHSPAAKVPVLKTGALLVWDSLAIIEYLADLHPEKAIWPEDLEARAVARAVSAEMHSGFQALREVCPMDILARKPLDDIPEPVQHNIRRIIQSWRECRASYGAGGPYLFGLFSAADAMYAPVCSRFRTYLPDLSIYGDDGTAARYVETMFALPAMQRWIDGARREVAAV